ncbi:MAG: Nif3-like dinuclear metal center hexameric protein [Halobacteriovoraceae bacterium]|nr:Nif3-like dinuclear metal center hexameric protein [Halobacteriovoraceae bacterium]
MLKRVELEKYLEELLKVADYADYCPNGLQIEGKDKIEKIAFSVSATADSVSKAVDWGADTLIVHHGVFWKHQGPRRIVGPQALRIKPLILNDINLFGYHLPLDGHSELGNAASLAKSLELTNLKEFGEYRRMPLGVQGTFASAVSAKELKVKIEKLLKKQITLASYDQDSKIKSIGIITGGANNEWVQARDCGLDAYLTGEISEYNWHDAIEEKIHYFACGHHATERFGVLALKKHLGEKFKVEVEFFDSDNPV